MVDCDSRPHKDGSRRVQTTVNMNYWTNEVHDLPMPPPRTDLYLRSIRDQITDQVRAEIQRSGWLQMWVGSNAKSGVVWLLGC
jgi:hypothetical protein